MDQIVKDFFAKFSQAPHGHGAIKHPAWTGGAGPSIILMHELDGFSKPFIQLALRLSNDFRIHAPAFYGKVGEEFSGPIGLGRALFCMRKEFEVLRLGETSPIAAWIRDLAADIQGRDPEGKNWHHWNVHDRRICSCNNFASLYCRRSGRSTKPALAAPLASPKRLEDLGMNQEDAKSAIDSSTPVLILRYGKDKICPAERINAIMTRIPSAVLPPQPLQGKLDGIGSHPTLTDQYRKSCTKEIVAVSDAAIKYVTQFLSDHLG